MRDSEVQLNEERTGYVMVLPVPGMATQMQSNMAGTLNIDWLLDMAGDLVSELGQATSRAQLLGQVNRWLAEGRPGSLLYHPYISEAGERGPFVDNDARASLVGLNTTHRFADLVRAVVEGLGMAAADCYAAMGVKPMEIRLSGGAARSEALRGIFSAAVGAPVRYASRDEAGAAGAAMMAAVAIGVYDSMDDCVEAWVNPLLSEAEPPDAALKTTYQALFSEYLAVRQALAPSWRSMARLRGERS
jgi:erythritol kinase